MKLTADQLQELYTALHYCSMGELKNFCHQFNSDSNGTKKKLIMRLYNKACGKLPENEVPIPAASRPVKGVSYPVRPETLMVYGVYKHSHEQRALFKQLVGDHFHFTAFGVDYLKERWRLGMPPTYQEFADFWQEEYSKRILEPVEPKEEWAYIRFVQRYLEQHPDAVRTTVTAAWKEFRIQQVVVVQKLLHKVFTSS